MKKLFMLTACILLSANTYSENHSGKVTTMYVNQKIWFRLDTMPPAGGSSVSCNTSSRYVIDATTDKGKNIYSMLLAAKATGMQIIAVGDNSCALHPDSEGVLHIWTP